MKRSDKKRKQYWLDRGYSEQDAIQKSYEFNSCKIEYWVKRGFTVEQGQKKIQEQYSSNMEYWVVQGYTKDEAIEFANIYGSTKSYHQKLYKFKDIEYWLALGYSEEQAEKKIQYYLSKNKRSIEYWIAQGLSKDEARKKLLENNPTSKIYWISRGYSEDDATHEIKKLSEKFPEYWIARGFSESDAIQKANEISDTGNVMSELHWIQLGYSEQDAKLKAMSETRRISKAMHDKWDRSFNRFTKEYWISKGYSENEAIEQARFVNAQNTKNIPKHVRAEATRKAYGKLSQEQKNQIHKDHSDYMKKDGKKKSPCFKEYWISKGYSDADAKKQSYLTRLGTRQDSGKLASKIETKCFNELSQYLNIEIIRQKWVTINNTAYCQDGRYKNIVFEFNGTRFHLDSRFYNESAVDPFNRTYEEVHNKDNRKKEAYLQKQYNIIVIWEYDYLNHKEKLFNEIERLIRTYVNESQNSGSYWSSASLFNKC